MHRPFFLKYPDCALDLVTELREKQRLDEKQAKNMQSLIDKDFAECDSAEKKLECNEILHRVSFKLAEITSRKSITSDLEDIGIIRVEKADAVLLSDFIRDANHSIKMVGISGHVLLEEESIVKPILREKIASQVEVKIMCLDPKCKYIAKFAKNDVESLTSIREEIKTGLAKFSTISGIIIGVYCQYIPWGLFS